MKIAYVIKRIVPAHDETGSSVASWAIVKSAQMLGHEVIIISYDVRRTGPGRAGVPIEKVYAAADAARKQGIKVFVLEEEKREKTLSSRISNWWQSIRKVLSPRPEDVYNGFRYGERVRKILRDEGVEVVWVWAADGASAVYDYLREMAASVVSLTDLDHIAREARRDRLKADGSLLNRISHTRQTISDRKLQEQVIDLVKPFDLVINHAFHHGEWWIDRGVRHLQYFPIPVLPNNSISGFIDHSQQTICKIVLVGYVTGNATLPGLKLLGEAIAPSLEKTLSPQELARLEIHIIGRGTLPKAVALLFESRPYIKVRGYVENLSAELNTSSIVLVPTPIELGFRTRIAEAFMYGACVIAHQANAKGMPELIHGENILLGASGPEIANHMADCLRNPSRRQKLSVRARETYVQQYDGLAVCSKILQQIPPIVKRRRGAPNR